MSYLNLDNGITEYKCLLCENKFSLYDHLSEMRKINKLYSDLALTAIHNICPDCLKYKPRIKKISENKVQILPRDLTKGLFYLFLVLVLISALALFYSLVRASFNLPNFPFKLYIAIHIIIVFFSLNCELLRSFVKETFFKSRGSELIFSITFLLLISFFVPSFRHIFYSYLPTLTLKIAATIAFIFVLYLENQLIEISLSRLFLNIEVLG